MGSRNGRSFRLAAVAIATLSHATLAQVAVEPRLMIGAGNATDALGVQSAALVLAPGLTLRPSSNLSLALNADVTRFTNEQWSAGGSGGFALRAPLTSFLAFSTIGSAGITRTSYQARYTSGELLPAIEATHGRLTLFAGVRGARGGFRMDDASPTRPLPVGNPSSALQERSAILRSAIVGAIVRADLGSAAGSLSVREERGSVGDSALVDRSIAGALDHGRLSLSAAVGSRQSRDVSEGYAQVAAAVTARPGVALQVAAGRYAANPLTSAVGGTYASVGVVLSRGSAAPRALERPPRITLRGETPPARGMTRMTVRAPGARQVELAGDWSSWKPVRARRAVDGIHWYVDLPLQRGRYRYAFRVDGDRWVVPEGVKAVDDGFGGKSAWVTIE